MTIDTETILATVSQPVWLGGLGFFFGLLVGSFLNVVIYRLPLEESVVSPPSHCPGCGAGIAAYDNIPVFSYLILRGACRECGNRISPRYPMIELLTGVVFALVALRFGFTVAAVLFAVFAGGLIVAGMVDFDHQIIPDEISLGGLGVGLVFVPLWQILSGESFVAAIAHSGFGALLGGGMLWTVGFLHARISVAMGREFEHWPGEGEEIPRPSDIDYWMWFPGIGFGDVKLLAAFGAWLGPWNVVETAIAAGVIGGFLALGLALGRNYMSQALSNMWSLLMFWRAAGLRPHPTLTLDSHDGPLEPLY